MTATIIKLVNEIIAHELYLTKEVEMNPKDIKSDSTLLDLNLDELALRNIEEELEHEFRFKIKKKFSLTQKVEDLYKLVYNNLGQ